MTWLACQTAPRAERRAVQAIADLGLDAYSPMRTVQVRHGRIVRDGRRPLFPGYVFAHVPGLIGLHAVRWSEGIAGIVGGVLAPSRVPDAIVADLRAAEALGAFDERPKPQPTFKPGEKVTIMTGAFTGFVATVIKAEPRRRVHVLLNALGGSTVAKIDAGALAPF